MIASLHVKSNIFQAPTQMFNKTTNKVVFILYFYENMNKIKNYFLRSNL